MAYWDRTKNNRLKKPAGVKLNFSTFDEENPDNITMYGQPFPEVGDYVFVGNTPSGGTVGKVLSYKSDYECHGGPAVEIEMLSGEIKTEWVTYALVIDYSAVQEVKDFYINDGRPERIKVSW